jgi:hypothetical protein
MKIEKKENPEIKKILQKHKLISKHVEIDRNTGKKTIYYIVRHKTQEEKYRDLIEGNIFKNN